MNHAEINEATGRMFTDAIIRNTVIGGALLLLAVILLAIVIVMAVRERKARKTLAVQRVVGGYEYRPVVTETVQVDRFGTEWHRMGVAGRVPE